MYNVKSKIQTIVKRLPLTAAILGAGLAMAQNTQFKSSNGASGTYDDYYFQFAGAHGEESDVTKWNQIDAATYNGLGCSSGVMGCRLKTTSVTGTSPIRPAEVDVNDNNTPQTSATVTEVKNKPAN